MCTTHTCTTCIHEPGEGRDEPLSGGVILETKKQPEIVLLKYFYFPPKNLPSRRHGFIPTFTCTRSVLPRPVSHISHLCAGIYIQDAHKQTSPSNPFYMKPALDKFSSKMTLLHVSKTTFTLSLSVAQVMCAVI